MPVLPPKHNWFVHLLLMGTMISLSVQACSYLVPKVDDVTKNSSKLNANLEQVYLGNMMQNMKDHQPTKIDHLTQLEQIKFRSDSLNSLVSYNNKNTSNIKIISHAIKRLLNNNKNQKSDEKELTEKYLKLIELYRNIVENSKLSKSKNYQKSLRIFLANIKKRVVNSNIDNSQTKTRRRLKLRNVFLNSNDKKLSKSLSKKTLKNINLSQFTMASPKKSFFNKFTMWLGSIYQNNNIENISKIPIDKKLYLKFLEESAENLVSKMNLARRVILNNLKNAVNIDKSYVSVPFKDMTIWLDELRNFQEKLTKYEQPALDNFSIMKNQLDKFTQFLVEHTFTNHSNKIDPVKIMKHDFEVFLCWYKDFKSMTDLGIENISILELDSKSSPYKELIENLENIKKLGKLNSWLLALDYKNQSENLTVSIEKTIDQQHSKNSLLEIFKEWLTSQNISYTDYAARLSTMNETINLDQENGLKQNFMDYSNKIVQKQMHYLELLEHRVINNLDNQGLQNMLTKEIKDLREYLSLVEKNVPGFLENIMGTNLWQENARNLINMHAFNTQNNSLTKSMDNLYEKYTKAMQKFVSYSNIGSDEISLSEKINKMPNFYYGVPQNSAIMQLNTFVKAKILMKNSTLLDKKFLDAIEMMIVAYASDNNANTKQITNVMSSQIEEFPKIQ